MEKYITQLIQDINKIISQLPEPPSSIWNSVDVENEAEVEDISYIEQMREGPSKKLQDVLGIKKVELPHESKLSDKQIEKLLSSLERLLEYHNYEPAYPADNLTSRVKYYLLHKIWDSEQPKVTFGVVGIEFCYFDEDSCPVPGNCETCQRFEEELEEDMMLSDQQLPEMEGDDWDILPAEEIKEARKEKIKQGIRDFKPNQDNIPGIFNYCDHWCARCRFTDRCSNFQMEKELGLDKEDTMDDGLENLGIILSESGKMVMNDLEKLGVDVEELVNEALNEPQDEEELGNNALITMAEEYLEKVKAWFEQNQDYLSTIMSKLFNASQPAFNQLRYHLDTINWYMTMIPIKMHRALDMDKDTNLYDDFEYYDRNATGRLLIDCIDNSMEAFTFLLNKFSDKEDEMLDFLAILSKLKKGLIKELPDAATFKRPGLDEE